VRPRPLNGPHPDADHDVQAGLLENFTAYGCAVVLAELDPPTGHRPLADPGFTGPSDHQELALVVVHERSDAGDTRGRFKGAGEHELQPRR
jgi:hypothetical protein